MDEMLEILRAHTSLNVMSDQEIAHFLASLQAAGYEIAPMVWAEHEVSPPAIEGEEVPE